MANSRNYLYSWWLFVFLFTGSMLVCAQSFPPVPSPPRLVNDFSGLLTPEEAARLERKLTAFDDSTSIQIAIVIMPSTGGDAASSYAPELAHKWGIGHKGRDNGILIFITTEEPREIFIATGYGVEEYVNDARAGDVVNNDLVPHFRNGSYYTGLEQATDHLMGFVKGTFKGFGKRRQQTPVSAFIVLIIIIVLVILFASRKGGRGRGGYTRTFGGPPLFGGFGGKGEGWSGGGGFGGFGGGGFGGGGAGGRW